MKKTWFSIVMLLLFNLTGKAQIPFHNLNSGRNVVANSENFGTISDKTGFLTGWTSVTNLELSFSAPPPNNFNLIIASDSQYPRLRSGYKPSSKNNTEAARINRDHVSSMNKLIEKFPPVKGVIMNGDLTEYGHLNQYNVIKDLYDDGSLKADFYPGLGNHDYKNNVGDCLADNCAERMVRYIRKFISSGGRGENFKADWDFKNEKGSLAYSWDIENVHFIQVHDGPEYEVKINEFTITKAYNWVENDLREARSKGKYIILNLHEPCQAKLLATEVNRYKVSAVFVGHYHEMKGRQASPDAIRECRVQTSIGNAPLFYCGSSFYHYYLFTEFRNDKMTVYRVNSNPDEADPRTFGRALEGTYQLLK